MKQMMLFSSPEAPRPTLNESYWKLHVDGASRNNPGPAGAGVYITKNGKVVKKEACYLGFKTNNQAEYFALLLGIYHVQQHAKSDDLVLIVSDSQLLVRQIQGEYKVKNSLLHPLYLLAKKWLKPLNYDIAHVMREENSEADELANTGIDKKIPLPDDFIQHLQTHDISL